MRITMRILSALLVTAVLGSIAPATASAQQGGGLSGWLHLSTRSLSLTGGVNGEEKYAEEYDYQEGFQLAGLTLQGTTAGQQFGLNAYGWGESPTATMDGWLAKSGLYRLRFGGYNSRYFHTTGSYVEEYGLDATPYAFTRRGRYADLSLSIGDLPDINIRYDRLRREGTNFLVWNIEREKHLALSPVDETSTSLQVATSLPLLIASVDLSYTLYSIDNRYGTVVADTSDGLDGRASRLYDYSHIIHDEGSLPVLKANISAPVGPATLRVGFSSSSGTVDKTLDEVESGIDYSGVPVDTTRTGTGVLDRSFSIIDAGASLSIIKGLSTDLSVRRTGYEISGQWDPAGGGTEVETAVSTTRIMGRMIWTPMQGVTVNLGGANITRTFEEGGVEELKTVATDWVGGVTYARQEWFNFRFSHRIGDIESPYTRISPTDRNTASAVLNLMPSGWLTASLAYRYGTAVRYYSQDSSDPGYRSNTRSSDFRTGTASIQVKGLPFLQGLSGWVSASRGRLEMSVPIAEFAPPSPPVYNYRDITYSVSGGAGYALAEGIDLLADGYWYRANGQWPLTRSMMRLGIALDLKVSTLHVDYRLFSLDQVVDDRDDFDASLITIGLSRGF